MKYRDDDYVGQFYLPPEGKYKLQIASAPDPWRSEITRGKNIGKEMLSFKTDLSIIFEDGSPNKIITIWIPHWEMSNIWRALGYQKNKENEWEIDMDEVVSRTFVAELYHEEYEKQGKTRKICKLKKVVIPSEYLTNVEKIPDKEDFPEPEKEEEDDIPF